MQDDSNGENCAGGEGYIWDFSVLSAQVFCKPKTILKNEIH